MKNFFVVPFVVLFSATSAYAVSLTFSWTPNTETDLAGYRIHYGPVTRGTNVSATAYPGFIDVKLPAIVDGKVVATVDIPVGNSFFAATAYDKDGYGSFYSNEVQAKIPPVVPTGFGVKQVAITYTFTPTP